MYDGNYFRAYAKDADDWTRGFRERFYYYKSLRSTLFRLKRNPASMVEIGCGLGMFSYAALLERPDMHLQAIDISEYAVSIVREKLARFPKAEASVASAENIVFPSESCDVVVSLDVIEHLSSPEQMVGHAFRILKSKGVFLFTTPNARSLGARLKANKSRRDLHFVDVSQWTWFADRDPTHVSVRSPDEWRALCERIGFRCIRDGSDACWDTPYFHGVPLFLQKLFFNGSYHLLMRLSPVFPWLWGENYVGFWQKP